ncbi:MAG: hypothetical protein V9H26_11875 [Verrucomicrobiota bacterium]
MKKNILLSLLLVLLRVGWSAEPAATNVVIVTPELVNQLAEEMREHNPALQAARERTNAAAANAGAVRTLGRSHVHARRHGRRSGDARQ